MFDLIFTLVFREFAVGNTFGATAFSSYGGFWISFGFLVSPWSGIPASYTKAGEFNHAVGFYLAGWTIFTFIMLIAAHRSSIGLIAVFFFLTCAFALLTAEHFVDNPVPVKIAGGYFGIITAFM